MASSQDGNDDIYDLIGGEEFLEECIEEYGLEDEYSSSSIHVPVVEHRVSPIAVVVKKPVIKTTRSSSENVSSVIAPFPSSSSLRSTFPPASWPSDVSKSDTYLQSSGGIEGALYPESDLSSSDPEQDMTGSKTEIFSRIDVEAKVLKSEPANMEDQKEMLKKGKCVKIPFLHDILEDALSQKPLTKIHFEEKLKISIDAYKTLAENNLYPTTKLIIPENNFAGDFSLNVEEMNDSVGVFIESCSSFKDGEFTNGTQLYSKTTRDLLLIEEKRIEFQYNDTDRQERSLYVFMGSDSYVAYRTNKFNDVEQKYRGCISLDWQSDFVLDGSLFGIMRHLIAVQFYGCFQCYAVTISGRVCRQVFCIDEKKLMQINEELIEVILLRKSTYDYETKKKIEMSETYFLPTGGMIYHSWKYSPYIVHMDPVVLFHDNKLNPCMELTWKSDCILYSMFEFEKEYSHCLLQKYLNSYPEVIELLNDYIIALFHEKPKSVLKFTCDFFEHV